jgi:hypothetical protein
MRQVAALKPGLTAEDMRVRAKRTLVECILNGTTQFRSGFRGQALFFP